MTDRARSVVTGAAGFIGSHLCERLLQENHEVIGVDCFSDYYPRWIKEGNLTALLSHPRFRFLETDLLTADCEGLLSGVAYLFHQAAQAGVRGSWGKNFEVYVDNNIRVTQRLLEAVTAVGAPLRRFVYASSSSVYGNIPTLPLREDASLRPTSPYGVTKLAAENLVHLYHENYGLPVVSLRYFTVYGPRQRPDMAFHKFARALLVGEPIVVYGDGEQTRDFTYVEDIVSANLLALRDEAVGQIFNIGGGARVSLRSTIATLEKVVGRTAQVAFQPPQRGDMRDTYADTAAARTILGYTPRVRLEEGLVREVEWIWATFASGRPSPSSPKR